MAVDYLANIRVFPFKVGINGLSGRGGVTCVAS